MNIKELLEENKIRYWTSGKNVSKNHINIQCPFCDDRSNHLGIRIYDLKCNCWKCGPKKIIIVISKILDCSYTQAKNILKQIYKKKYYDQKEKIDFPKKVILPEEATKNFSKQHLKYLRKRGFKPQKLIDKYNLFACGFEGDYKFRIIIPITMNNKIVSFTSRDITNQQELRYKDAKPKESALSKRECIFNYDRIKQYKDAIWVEGPFDVMKIGNGGFCFMGIEMTAERIIHLSKKKINTLYTIQDNDPNMIGEIASIKTSSLSYRIAKKIVNIKLKTKNDPGELTFKEVEQIKREIGFNYDK